jgi:16S rRNA (guanine527-N7)-methyltransferase
VRGDPIAVTHPLPEWMEPARAGLETYAGLLADVGVTAGLIGPREVPRLWHRHILNCAVVAGPDVGLVPADAAVADVGSGAGLPGLVWALVRPDLEVWCLEPLLRRSTFLAQAVVDLELTGRVHVERMRAEEVGGDWPGMDVVTARAVAPLNRLLPWAVPLMKPSGRVVALKGSSAEQEIAEAAKTAATLGLSDIRTVVCGVGEVDPPARVVVATR